MAVGISEIRPVAHLPLILGMLRKLEVAAVIDRLRHYLKRRFFGGIPVDNSGIRVRRDNWASVRYAEGLNSSKSSVTLQSTDRHDILGQKSSGFQLSL